MRRWARRTGALALAGAFVLGLGTLTRLPYRVAGEDEARVRLSWRIRGEQAGGCRTPTAEELEALPVHMRNPDACVGSVPPFRLRVEVDGRVVLDDEVRPSGARGDRPVYVFRDLPVGSGAHRVRIHFVQQEGADAGDAGTGGTRRPLRLELDRELRLGPRQIALVTLDADRMELVVLRSPPEER